MGTTIAGITIGPAMLRLRGLERDRADTLRHLATGLQIGRGRDGPAKLIAGQAHAAERARIGTAVDNAGRAQGLARTADAVLGEIGGMLHRLRAINGQAADNTLPAAERAALQLEADAIVRDIDRVAAGAEYAGKPIFRATPPRIDGPEPPEPDHYGEVERAITPINGGWSRATFSDPSYGEPIVVTGPTSFNDPGPGGIRVDNVDPTGFDFRFQEYNYQDGLHASERFAWMAVPAGVHVLPDGTTIEAGSTTTGGTPATVTLTAGFAETPVILTQIVTANDNTAAFARVYNATAGGFQVYAEEEQAREVTARSGSHGPETLHYVAVQTAAGTTDGTGHTTGGTPPGKPFHTRRTPDYVKHNWKTVSFPGTGNPTLLGQMSGEDGTDPATLRYRNLGGSSVQVRVWEEQSSDAEQGHTSEPVDLLVFAGTGRFDKTPEPPPPPAQDLLEVIPRLPGDPDEDADQTQFLFSLGQGDPGAMAVLRLAELSARTLGNGAVKLSDLVSGGDQELTSVPTGNNAAEGAIDEALATVNGMRAHVGRFLSNTVGRVKAFHESADARSAANRSQIVDADMARQTAELARQEVLRQSATTLLSDQQRAAGQRLLSLLG